MWNPLQNISFPLLLSTLLITSTAQAEDFFAALYRSHEKPHILLGKQNGNNWVQSTINLPSGFEDFDAIYCDKNTCLATGGARRGELAEVLPVLFASNDGGEHWQENQLPPVPFSGYGLRSKLTAIKCQDSFCFAVGYTEGSLEMHPLFLQSFNRGKTWSIENEFPKDGIRFTDNYCNKNVCIAVATQAHMPLIKVTADKGKTWVDVKKIANLPVISNPRSKKDYFYWRIDKIKCNDSFCFAFGEYTSNYEYETNYHNFVLSSDGSGKEWTFMDPSSMLGNNAEILQGDCSKSSCFILGTNNHQNVMMESSSHVLWSWNSLHDSEMPIPDKGSLTALTCGDDVCFVAGEVNKQPFIMHTTAKDFIWKQSSVFNIPANSFKRMYISHIKCKQKTCVAFGEGLEEWNKGFKTVVLISNDLGESWYYNPSVAFETLTIHDLIHN